MRTFRRLSDAAGRPNHRAQRFFFARMPLDDWPCGAGVNFADPAQSEYQLGEQPGGWLRP